MGNTKRQKNIKKAKGNEEKRKRKGTSKWKKNEKEQGDGVNEDEK